MARHHGHGDPVRCRQETLRNQRQLRDPVTPSRKAGDFGKGRRQATQNFSRFGRSSLIRVIDRISLPSPNSLINEDAVGATNTGAWVIDGATGVSDRPPIVAATTDAAWLAERLSAELRSTFDMPDLDPVQALSRVEANIKSEFLALTRGVFCPASEQPSAALASVVLRGKTLHLIGVADCRIIYETCAGDIGEFNPSDSGAVEAVIIAERSRLLAEYPGEDLGRALKVSSER